jgi:Ca2+-binding EF-hand superfamily protein
MTECDLNHNQNIDYSEFILCTLDIQTVNPKILASAFKHYTKGEGEVITRDHIFKALQLSGHDLDDEAITKILTEAGDGTAIDFEHFTNMLSRT